VNSSSKVSYIFRKYPLVRVLLLLVSLAVIVVGIAIFGYKSKPLPTIESVVPSVGVPGDLVTINGKNFGSEKDMNYVEFAGSKLTSSSFVSWSDDCIKLILPANVQDGLVIVGVNNMRSKPAMFANETEIPIPVPETSILTKPTIFSLSSGKVAVGDLLTITGTNFGESRNQSRVLFSLDYDDKIKKTSSKDLNSWTENMIPVSEFEFGYEYWSNSEIRVRVPDGAYTGVLIVDTVKEASEPEEIVIDTKAGEKNFYDKKIYLMKYTADIADIVTNNEATITLRCPIPVEMPSQVSVEIPEISPMPILKNYQKNIIHQVECNKVLNTKKVFSQTFVVPVTEIRTSVNPDKIGAYSKASESLVSAYTKADSVIQSESDEILTLSQLIVKREKNVYRKAKLIYDYMLANYEVLPSPRSENANPMDLISKKRGDAYDFSVIFTALLRSQGIPALMDCGVLINNDLKSDAHWWCEFYIQNVGWIPVDLALAGGMEYGEWKAIENPKEYYFGNLDSHHVTFSRGVNQLKPFTQDSKIVQRPKSFALQSFWEEASNNTVKYSSYWSKPIIEGVY